MLTEHISSIWLHLHVLLFLRRGALAARWKMASKIGGFDLSFADSSHDRFVCSICTKVMRDPQLMLCCGVKYCASCLDHWFSSHRVKSCPHCRASECEEPILHALDKGMKREIESFRVHCTNVTLGCKWVGELRELANHHKSSTGCAFSFVKCTNKCKSIVLRKDLQDHLNCYCDLRLIKCQYCEYVDTAKAYGGHEDVCDMYPIQCPNGCGNPALVRCMLNDHLRSICPLELIPCENASLGCEERVLRKRMRSHLRHNCELRKIHCEFCNCICRVNNYSTHKLVCERHPMECPNNCGEPGLVRESLAGHREECKLEVVLCEFAHVGCNAKMVREAMPRHIETDQAVHLELMTRAYKNKEALLNEYKKEIETKKQCILWELRQFCAPYSMKKSVEEQLNCTHILNLGNEMFLRMINYSDLKQGNEWISPFLTYKKEVYGFTCEACICLRVFMCGENTLVVQFRVIKVNTPFPLQRSIHLKLLGRNKQKVKVLSTVARVKLSAGCTIGAEDVGIDANWEENKVVQNSILWTIELV